MDPSAILAPDGLISAKLPGYEHRPQQLRMAELVGRAFVDKKHLIIEAGTGVGKSFAYLVPAIEMVHSQPDKRVVISTHTIALQEQLIEKDIPFLKKVFPNDFKAVLVKGRSNYLCLRRLAFASVHQDRLFGSESELKNLWRIEDWAGRTRDGSTRSIRFAVSPRVWRWVCADRNSCHGRSCQLFSKCFYQASRRQTRAAHILVVNHALFFADLVLREKQGSVLPSYDAVVLDEAHRIEEVAGDHLGGRISPGQVEYLLNILYNPQKQKGVLPLSDTARSARQAAVTARSANEQFFAALAKWQRDFGRSNGRLSEPIVMDNTLSPALCQLAELLRELSLKSDEDQLELAGYAGQAQELADQLQTLLEQKVDSAVYWIESEPLPHGRRGLPRCKLVCAPINVGPDLQRLLWSKTDSVVLTSATLSVGPSELPTGSQPQEPSADDFEFLRSRLGLTQVDRARLGSPFDFSEQVTVHVEAGLGHPNDSQFLPGCCQAIKKYIQMSRGKAFVLFTSWQMLTSVAHELAEFFDEQEIALLIQKQGTSRTHLLNTFRKDTDSVLFGTMSFWQGVDVKGPALSNVIITKLPFAVPDEPLIQARMDSIRNKGGNPFMDYQLPEAILRFKQGFGRLIRSRADRGIVAILDSRLVTQRYGQRFLQALPKCRVTVND
ncbi:MAG: DEAD/DEAH box helicase [Actinobacteria bacterium]|nr:DEAD/DEAH box helicase [Actinomycetota bacterium]